MSSVSTCQPYAGVNQYIWSEIINRVDKQTLFSISRTSRLFHELSEQKVQKAKEDRFQFLLSKTTTRLAYPALPSFMDKIESIDKRVEMLRSIVNMANKNIRGVLQEHLRDENVESPKNDLFLEMDYLVERLEKEHHQHFSFSLDSSTVSHIVSAHYFPYP